MIEKSPYPKLTPSFLHFPQQKTIEFLRHSILLWTTNIKGQVEGGSMTKMIKTAHRPSMSEFQFLVRLCVPSNSNYCSPPPPPISCFACPFLLSNMEPDPNNDGQHDNDDDDDPMLITKSIRKRWIRGVELGEIPL